MPNDKAGRVLFIGNIPYGLTEEQIVHLFSSAGEVLNFRLVYDKDTGRPKGFGFAEFADADSAASAVRNLNGHETMGRTLRVDYSNEDGGKDSVPSNQTPQQQQPAQAQNQQVQQQNGTDPQHNTTLPPMPPGIDLPPNVTCPDSISQTLANVPPAQLLDMISQLKGLVMNDPKQAVMILGTRPQLAYAIFQALLLLGLVDTKALGQVVQADSQPQVQQPPQQQLPQSHLIPPQQTQQQFTPQPQMQNPYQPQFQQPMNMSTPPVANQAYRPPQPGPQKPPDLTDFQWDQLRAIISLPQSQVDAMQNPAERNTVLQIRQQWGPIFAQHGVVMGY